MIELLSYRCVFCVLCFVSSWIGDVLCSSGEGGVVDEVVDGRSSVG